MLQDYCSSHLRQNVGYISMLYIHWVSTFTFDSSNLLTSSIWITWKSIKFNSTVLINIRTSHSAAMFNHHCSYISRTIHSKWQLKILTEWLFVRNRTCTSTGYSSGTGTRFALTTDERSEDCFRVRIGLDTSFMAEQYSIIQVKTTSSNTGG